jgi:NADH dehydrogenase
VTVFVTGGTGFVGPAVAHAIRARGEEVRALVRERRRGEQLEHWGCELLEGDVTDPESLRRGVEGADVVVHLVAIRQGKPEQFERVMSAATRDLVAAVEQAAVRRLVLMSALGTSEETKDLVPYYRAKWDMEQAVKGGSVEHVVFRPSFVFGREGGILPTFRKVARLTPVTPIIGSGDQRIQPIWIEDVADYFAAAIDKPEAANRTFELGGPDVVTWNEFWTRLRRALGIRRRPSMHVPVGLMRMNALVTERLPGNVPLTRDLLKMLEGPDNVVTNDEALRTFQLPLVPLDEQLRRAA